MQESYLFPTLEAGSGRVFNICAKTAELIGENGGGDTEFQPDLLFHNRALNHVIMVKEARPHREILRFDYNTVVGTKLYLPYEITKVYDGGKSAFVDDPSFDRILVDHFGLGFDIGDEKDKLDLDLIRMLDRLPSLDPFLIKDRVKTEGLTVNEAYFQIPEAEWEQIRTYVSDKLKPIITFAFPDSEATDVRRTNALVNKLWNTKDISELQPVVAAFGLPESEASEIFSAWKGVLYYEFEYNRCLPQWTRNFEWMKDGAKPTDLVDADARAYLIELSNAVRGYYRDAWQEIAEIFSAYNESYEKLFVHRSDAAPFIDFMRDAVRIYWILGSRISALNHSVAIWDILTANRFRRQMKHEMLCELFDLQLDLFRKSW